MVAAILGRGQLQAFPMVRVDSCSRCSDVAMKLQPHEAWRVLADIIHGERVINTAPRRPVVGALDQAPLDFLKDWLGVEASDGNIYCEGEWRAACPLQIYGCRHIVTINAEGPVRGGCGLRALGHVDLSFSGHFLEWARDIILAMRSHLKAELESERGGSDPVSTRLRDAHIELHLMLVRAPSPLPPPCLHWQAHGWSASVLTGDPISTSSQLHSDRRRTKRKAAPDEHLNECHRRAAVHCVVSKHASSVAGDTDVG